jgi:membrane-associated phospholipid phosphatase
LATPVTLQETRRALSFVIGILPADEESSPSISERLRFIRYVVMPWLLLYAVTAKLASHGASFGMPFEDRLPILSWTAPIYQSIYVVIALAPWWVRTRRDLRRLMISSWLSMAVVFPFYWLVPSSAPRRALLGQGWVTSLLGIERTAFPPIAAFPSFHVLWAIFLGRACRWRWIGWTYAALIAVSCITTGQHYIADVVCSVMIAPAFLEPEHAWKLSSRWFEQFAKRWQL